MCSAYLRGQIDLGSVARLGLLAVLVVVRQHSLINNGFAVVVEILVAVESRSWS